MELINKGQGKHFNESEDVTNKRLIFKLSLAGFITYISKNTKVMIGYEPKELIGTHIKNIMHHEDYEKVRDKCQFEDNEVFSSILRLLKKDGKGRLDQCYDLPVVFVPLTGTAQCSPI